MLCTLERSNRFFQIAPMGLFLLLVQGCALFGGGGAITHAEGVHVNTPTDWKSEEKTENDLTYRTTAGNIVTMTSSCTRNADQPLEVLTKLLFLGSRNVVIKKREPMSIRGAKALYSSVSATSDGVPFNLEVCVVTKNDCIFDFTLVSPRAIPERDIQDFLAFIKSFKYGKN